MYYVFLTLKNNKKRHGLHNNIWHLNTSNFRWGEAGITETWKSFGWTWICVRLCMDRLLFIWGSWILTSDPEDSSLSSAFESYDIGNQLRVHGFQTWNHFMNFGVFSNKTFISPFMTYQYQNWKYNEMQKDDQITWDF